MTYRLDSDLHRPYGWFSPLQSPPKPFHQPKKLQGYDYSKMNPPMQKFSWLTPTAPSSQLQIALKRLEKPRLVAWLASNCDTHSDREDYVEQLRKHIEVDVFGKCGDKNCGPANGGASNLECDAMIEKNYKFFLAFENSICTDYVTEKFFRTLSRLIVPVVLGGSNYSRLAPPGSYINALDYPSPVHLAKGLKRLAEDGQSYNQHFWWKDHYEVHHVDRESAREAMCSLCSHLHSEEEKQKSYTDLGAWWESGGRCRRKGSFPWSRSRLSWGKGLFSFLLPK